MKIGDKIKELREKKGWTVTQLAETSEVSKAYISQLENIPDKKVSADILFKIATALGTTMGVLMGKEVPISKSADIPRGLRMFAENNNLTQEEVEMLAGIKYRGKQPQTEKDWGFVYNTIKLATQED
jgi:XRE family transcriptional regulator, master regulator for biofilm formation